MAHIAPPGHGQAKIMRKSDACRVLKGGVLPKYGEAMRFGAGSVRLRSGLGGLLRYAVRQSFPQRFSNAGRACFKVSDDGLDPLCVLIVQSSNFDRFRTVLDASFDDVGCVDRVRRWIGRCGLDDRTNFRLASQTFPDSLPTT